MTRGLEAFKLEEKLPYMGLKEPGMRFKYASTKDKMELTNVWWDPSVCMAEYQRNGILTVITVHAKDI